MWMYTARPGARGVRPAGAARMGAPMAGSVAAVASAVLCLVLAGAGRHGASWVALGAFAALSGVLGLVSRPGAAPAVGTSCWLLFNGFVVHRYGGLGWSGTAVEASRWALFTAPALLAALPAAWPRRRVRTGLVRLPAAVPAAGPREPARS